MNDEEKIIACSGMLHKEMESWSDTSERDFSEEEKLNEIYNLQSIIAGAKAILDDVYAMPDKEKLEAIQKIFHECTALDHSLVRAERFLTADGQSEIRETQKKAFQKIKDIVES